MADWVSELVSSEADAGRIRRALLEVGERASRTGCWAWDQASDRAVASENLLRIHGLPVDDLSPSPSIDVLSFIHPDDRPRFEEALDRARAGDPRRHLEYRIVTRDGVTRFVHAALAAELVADSHRLLIGWLRDVTSDLETAHILAVHAAVSAALGDWDGFEPGAERLLSGLADALGLARGVLWTPREDQLAPRLIAPSVKDAADAHDSRAAEAVTVSWETAEPAVLSNGHSGASAQAPSPTSVSIPLIASGEILGVIELVGASPVEVGPRLRAALTGIGHEIGAFIVRWRGAIARGQLSHRELELLRLAADGLSGPEIARRLHLSPATVKTHFENIYRKYDVPDRTSAVAKALREGILL
jgi:DNA-binding NarL/FixJ family response regulator/PAS domain-containing protein